MRAATSPARAEGCLETALKRDCALSKAAAPCATLSSLAVSASEARVVDDLMA